MFTRFEGRREESSTQPRSSGSRGETGRVYDCVPESIGTKGVQDENARTKPFRKSFADTPVSSAYICEFPTNELPEAAGKIHNFAASLSA